ncbi:arylesterase [Vibrio sp. Of14-4]|uniref:Arylesterase n=1 Tax=Vibrio tetraodonis subsp. pristinus TaxID=2695891 RepID=A0A6L8LXW6_9VIBR|nr:MULTISPECIES: arylesterase [Vibrio]MCG7490748.1 arylesterase [Vibrio sp. Of14-4]MYM60343.1 arylesterase [Vibrio tetraodonis subsp. pristinus]
MIRLLSLLLLLTYVNPLNAAKLLVLGDSLSAGYQMSIDKAWPTLLPNVIAKTGRTLTVVNASVSGDTTGNGLDRLPTLLNTHTPDIVLIELGANDGLRGFSPKLIQDNLRQIIQLVQSRGAKALLMQIHILPNYGKRYTQAFADLYPMLSKQLDVPLLPFFLEGVITNTKWMMDDGLHPNEKAQPWIAEFVAQNLIKYL